MTLFYFYNKSNFLFLSLSLHNILINIKRNRYILFVLLINGKICCIFKKLRHASIQLFATPNLQFVYSISIYSASTTSRRKQNGREKIEQAVWNSLRAANWGKNENDEPARHHEQLLRSILERADLYDREEKEEDNPWHKVVGYIYTWRRTFPQVERKINQFAGWCFVLARPDR